MSAESVLQPDRVMTFDDHKRLILDGLSVRTAVAYQRVEDIDRREYGRAPAEYLQRVTDAIRHPEEPYLPTYAVFEEPGSSRDTAVVIHLPFTNAVRPDVSSEVAAKALAKQDKKGFDSNDWNNGLKFLYLYDFLKNAGITDDAGNNLPVIVIPGISPDFNPKLSHSERKALVEQGDFSPLVTVSEEILEREGFGLIHAGGYSAGGTMTHSFMANAKYTDVLSGTIGETPSYKDRSVVELIKNYMFNIPTIPKPEIPEGMDANEPWTESGPQARRDMEAINNGAVPTMAKSIALGGGWRVAMALRHATLAQDLLESLDGEAFRPKIIPVTLEYGATSALTHDFEDQALREGTQTRTMIDLYRRADRFRLVKTVGGKAVGAPHLHGESPLFNAIFFTEAIQWAQKQTAGK